MIKTISRVVVSGLFALTACRDDRPRPNVEMPGAPEPAPTPQPEGTKAPEGTGGGPIAMDGRDRESAIDRLANARCQAAERCGAVGVLRDHTSFSECVEIARADLRGSFGAATCGSYDEEKLATCARRTGDAACGSEKKLFDDCVESKLCK